MITEDKSTREYQLWLIASEVRQWISENPESPHISVFGRSKAMFEAWLECLDNAPRDLIAQGMEKAAEMCDADWDDEVHYQQRILAAASAIRASAVQLREGKGP